MKKNLTIIASLCLYLTGCGTVAMREYPSCKAQEFSYYPGTLYDGLNIFEGGQFYANELVDNKVGRITTGWFVVVPLHIVDLPVSIVTDTLLLPRDLITEFSEKKPNK